MSMSLLGEKWWKFDGRLNVGGFVGFLGVNVGGKCNVGVVEKKLKRGTWWFWQSTAYHY